MLKLLRARCKKIAPNTDLRLQTHQTDALSYLATPSHTPYDLIVTHFFLDCLTQPEVETLAAAIATKVAPEALWLVSDFQITSGGIRLPAKLLVQSLYLAFRIFTGLRVKHLPDHATALTNAGFICIASFSSLFGILTSELWTFPSPASSRAAII